VNGYLRAGGAGAGSPGREARLLPLLNGQEPPRVPLFLKF
jgi:hypothetical protein